MPNMKSYKAAYAGHANIFAGIMLGCSGLFLCPQRWPLRLSAAEKTNQRANVRALFPQGTAVSSVKRAPVRMGGTTRAPCARAAFDSVSCRCVRKPRLQIAR